MKNSKSVGIALVVMMLLGLTCGAHLAWGQEVTAGITGRVTDSSGAPIVGASVTARDVARDVSYPTETNAEGVYYLTRSQISRYEIKIEAKGFRTAVRPAVELVLNQVARVDVQLVAGTVSETVEITSP